MDVTWWEWYLYMVVVRAVVYGFHNLSVSIGSCHNGHPYENLEVDGVCAEPREYYFDLFSPVAACELGYGAREQLAHLGGISAVCNANWDDGKLVAMVACKVLVVFGEEL